MRCTQCQGIGDVFDEKYVTKDLADYRLKGPDKTTRMLVDAIKKGGVEGLTLLDIGGGVGVVQHELLAAGVQEAANVEASAAYIAAAKDEAQRRGLAERISHQHGNFVDVAETVAAADIVTLDRVICCYPEMEKLVSLSAARARKLYGLVYPRDTWWVKIGLATGNFFLWLQRSRFRTFVHPTEAVEAIVQKYGLARRYYCHTLIWQVVVYAR
jgi:magnesium-protoporphyrin O-methyltransferase